MSRGYRKYYDMNEFKINTLFDIIVDPVENVYNLDSEKSIQNMRNIINTFKIAKEQKKDFQRISARGLVAFKMLVSNN